MSEIDDLSQRIIAALDRIGRAADALEQPAPETDSGELDALRTALEDEKQVTAQLEERIRKLKSDHAAELAALRAQVADQAAGADKLAALDTDLQRLRKANDQLRDSNAALREANEAGVGEPHLINSAMLAELEALRAARAVDVSEADAIMDQLVPLLDRARQAPEGEEA
jgi:DNA repair exonuclease SbcCD ATPase subunit